MNKLLKQPVNPCMRVVLREIVVNFTIITRPALQVVAVAGRNRELLNLSTPILDTQQLAKIMEVALRVFLVTHCLSGDITVAAATLDGL